MFESEFESSEVALKMETAPLLDEIFIGMLKKILILKCLLGCVASVTHIVTRLVTHLVTHIVCH